MIDRYAVHALAGVCWGFIGVACSAPLWLQGNVIMGLSTALGTIGIALGVRTILSRTSRNHPPVATAPGRLRPHGSGEGRRWFEEALLCAALEFHEAKHQPLPVTPESNIRWWSACAALDAACEALKQYDATVVDEVP